MAYIDSRIIPCLLIADETLVKTIKFKKPAYVGDPINAIKIYNEKEVDELILLDINSTRFGKEINFNLISKIVNECFMPVVYGGGIQNLDQIRRLLKLGVEKVSVNSYAFKKPSFIREAAQEFGSQCIVAAIDSKKNLFGKESVYSCGGTINGRITPTEHAEKMAEMGAGEILLTSIDRDGTWGGYDLELIKKISALVKVPLIACGGAGSLKDIQDVICNAGASAAAIGSMVVYHKKDLGVLINFPSKEDLRALFAKRHVL